MALQDVRNKLLQGKKIFEAFDEAEKAVNELLDKEANARDLDDTIAKRRKELEKLDGQADAARGNLEKADIEAKRIVQDARDQAEQIIAKAGTDGEKTQAKLKKQNDDLVDQHAELMQMIEDSKQELDGVKDEVTNAKAELRDVENKVKTQKEALQKAVSSL